MTNTSLQILAFGRIAEILGNSELEVPYQTTTDNLKGWLESNYPGLKGSTYAIAIDKKIQESSTELRPGSQVALLPPFSGG